MENYHCTGIVGKFFHLTGLFVNKNVSIFILYRGKHTIVGLLVYTLQFLQEKLKFSLVVWVKQLSVMVGGDFFQNETKVLHSQPGFHTCGGLGH